ncbi:MAG TPA: hypothetical protein VM123_14425 [archaeon]|nr:hypothetical protein [archaeon]
MLHFWTANRRTFQPPFTVGFQPIQTLGLSLLIVRKKHFALLLALPFLMAYSSGSQALAGEVVFSDDFESGVLAERWEGINSTRPEGLGFETRAEYVHSGKRSLRLTAHENGGNASVAQVTRWFMPGYDRLYFRWYAMFAVDFDQGNLMHWTFIGGSRTDNKWSAFGTAGLRPGGADFFTTMLEPWRNWGEYPPPGALHFYTNYPDMTQAPDGNYWGNHFDPQKPFLPDRGRWYCFEVMVKLNTPGSRDGEQAFWIDGEKILHADSIRWRDSEVLKLNAFWFGVYIHKAVRDNTCWYDDLIISTDYIGPENGERQGDGK